MKRRPIRVLNKRQRVAREAYLQAIVANTQALVSLPDDRRREAMAELADWARKFAVRYVRQ